MQTYSLQIKKAFCFSSEDEWNNQADVLFHVRRNVNGAPQSVRGLSKVLSSQSEVFKTMMTIAHPKLANKGNCTFEKTGEGNSCSEFFLDEPYDLFSHAIQLMHGCSISLPIDHIIPLANLGLRYKIPSLVQTCLQVINSKTLSTSNTFQILELARAANSQELEEQCLSFLLLHFGEMFHPTSEALAFFCECDEDTVKAIIEYLLHHLPFDSRKSFDKEKLCDAIHKWGQCQLAKKQKKEEENSSFFHGSSSILLMDPMISSNWTSSSFLKRKRDECELDETIARLISSVEHLSYNNSNKKLATIDHCSNKQLTHPTSRVQFSLSSMDNQNISFQAFPQGSQGFNCNSFGEMITISNSVKDAIHSISSTVPEFIPYQEDVLVQFLKVDFFRGQVYHKCTKQVPTC
jgi:hypothetical protein